MVKALACSLCLVEKGMGPPLRGLVHSAFSAAANLLFADGSLLSLNASTDPARNPLSWGGETTSNGTLGGKGGLLMPNGLLLSARAGEFPFSQLRAGMPVMLGAGWLLLEPLACSFDILHCERWNPHIESVAPQDQPLVRANGRWLVEFCQREHPHGMPELAYRADETIVALADKLCGRGPGLTPGGDDFLAGWMAAGWLLYGPYPPFLALCQHICQLARTRTHLLSQCWLAYAAAGDVALPVRELLAALTTPALDRLEHAARGLLALGATSGFALLQGVLAGLLASSDGFASVGLRPFHSVRRATIGSRRAARLAG